ncbi:MAG: cupin domain-containing protein [Bacteroidota bacterium]
MNTIKKPKQSNTQVRIIKKSEWIKVEGPPKGVVQGHPYGFNAVIIRYSVDAIGEGPNLHVHPYDELFHILKGQAEFTVGDQKIIAQEGDLVIGPANIPHAYKNLGPGSLDTLDIHLNPEWIQYDLARKGEELSSLELLAKPS